jgi:hypothetical protein
MKMRRLRMEDGGWQARSVLECGDTSPLSHDATCRGVPKRGHVRALQGLLFCFILLHSSFCLRVQGQSYSIDWYKIAAGGGTSTGGVYSVSGTIGQHDAGGPMTGGNYSLTGGFWALIQVVQTAGAPTLFISHSGNTVTVYWQAVSGWNLVQSGNVATPMAGWTASSSPTLANGTNYLNLVNPTGSLFFRLAK